MSSNRRKVTSAKPMFGNKRSFSMRANRRKFNPNMQNKRIYVPEYDRWVRVRVSTSELRTIDKIGLHAFLKRQGMKIEQLL